MDSPVTFDLSVTAIANAARHTINTALLLPVSPPQRARLEQLYLETAETIERLHAIAQETDLLIAQHDSDAVGPSGSFTRGPDGRTT
ncbi:hypothetical protein NJBCHELONAE_43220 [Mycobacteroides chelonae]|nr:hypothetical protein NJBCHELONAE_43220 [Mycobacteroides chelonae]